MASSLPPQQARRPWVIVTVVAVAAIAVIAGLGTVWWLGSSGSQSSHAGMSTGLNALALVEASLSKVTTQSWAPISDLGIASQMPYTPGTMSENESAAADLAGIEACESLPFPSVWNVSGLPDRAGNLTDGFAPFWQFLFENESGPGQFVFAIGVYVAGGVYVAAPLAENNSCIQGLGMDSATGPFPLANPNLETNLGGPLAYAAVSRFNSLATSYAVLWTDGWSMISNNGWGSFADGGGAAWGVTFYACGQTGVEPLLPSWIAWHAGVESQNGTPIFGGVFATQFICTQSQYNVTLEQGGTSILGSDFATSLTLEVSGSDHGWFGNVSDLNDSQGVAAWMVLPEVFNASQVPLPLAYDTCPVWVPGIGSCAAPTSGWYAVLLSPSGRWLDSYGLIDGSGTWSAPNVPIVSHESLVVLYTHPVTGTGDTFVLDSQVASPQIQATTAGL